MIFVEFMTWLKDNEGKHLKEEMRALVKQFLESRKDDSIPSDPTEYDSLENSFGNVLQFYGVELQSHAAQLLGISILIFTIIQAWGQLGANGGARYPLLFAAFVGVLGLGIVHQVLRLYRYGKQATAILHSSLDSFTKDKEQMIDLKWRWEKLSKFTKVSLHSDARFAETAGLKKIGLYYRGKKDKRFKQSFWLLSVGFATAFLFSYFLIFGSLDWSIGLFVGPVLVILATLLADFLRWQVLPLRS